MTTHLKQNHHTKQRPKQGLLLLLIMALLACLLLAACAKDDPIDTTDTTETTDTTPPPAYETIAPGNDFDAEGMTLLWSQSSVTLSSGKSGKLALYADVELDSAGKPQFDDRQQWALLLETDEGNYMLFGPEYVQLGNVDCRWFYDYAEGKDELHVVVTVTAGAGLLIYDCAYDAASGLFNKVPLAEYSNINYMGASRY